MMKLTAFRIKNFRSIVDTGWQSLSSDNITCLIGQNESGKTSVLEGLKVFYTGVISEDVLRSDLSLPEVSCRFAIPKGWLIKITENPGTELRELLSELTALELTRSWIADLSSVISVSGEISQYLNSLEDAWRLYLDDVTAKLKEEMNTISELEKNLSALSDEESVIRSKFATGEAGVRGFSLFRKRSSDTNLPQNNSSSGLKNQLHAIKKKKEEIAAELSKKQGVKRTGERWN